MLPFILPQCSAVQIQHDQSILYPWIFPTHLTEYLGAGKSESGVSEGSIMGPGEQEGERSGESGPSVAELRSCSEALLLLSHSWVSGTGLSDTKLSSIVTPPPKDWCLYLISNRTSVSTSSKGGVNVVMTSGEELLESHCYSGYQGQDISNHNPWLLLSPIRNHKMSLGNSALFRGLDGKVPTFMSSIFYLVSWLSLLASDSSRLIIMERNAFLAKRVQFMDMWGYTSLTMYLLS